MYYRPDIDGLRTLAVVPVVLEHARLGSPGGYVGVDVFFVISGFLITSILLGEHARGDFSLWTFYERRAKRLFPALFVVLACCLILGAVLMLPSDFEMLAKSTLAATGFAANLWFYTQTGYFDQAAELKPLLHTWSLGVEEQFYLLFPLLLWALIRWGPKRLYLPMLAGLALLSLGLAEYLLPHRPDAVFYLPHWRAWELLIGSCLALVLHQGLQNRLPGRLNGALSVLGLALILGPVMLYDHETGFPGLKALPPCLGAALLIFTGLQPGSPAARLLSTRPFVAIGKISYSLYLWHWPILVFALYVTPAPLTPVQSLFCVLAAFVAAALSYRLVERPFRTHTHTLGQLSRRKVFAATGLAMAVVAGISTGIVLRGGLPERMPPRIQELAAKSGLIHDRRDCHFVTTERVQQGDICLRGAPGVSASFALIGDSHADALSPAVFAAAKTLGLAGYQITAPGYQPLPGATMWGAQEKLALTEQIVEFIRARPELSTLILTGFWEHYLTGRSYRTDGAILRDPGYDGRGSAYNPTAFANGLTELAEQLGDVQILLLDDVPTGAELHLPALLRKLRFYPDTRPGLPRATADAQRAGYEPQLMTLAAGLPSVHYRTVFTKLCDAEICPLFSGQTALFRDGDHLSWPGALRLKPELIALLSAQRGQARLTTDPPERR